MYFLIRSPRHFVLRLIGWTLVAVLAIPVLGVGIWLAIRIAAYSRAAAELPAQIAAAKREGIPLTADELNRSMHSSTAEGENAAPLYRSLLAISEAKKTEHSAVGVFLKAVQSGKPTDTAAIQSHLAAMSEEMAVAEKASRLRCDWERDWANGGLDIPFPEQRMGRDLVRLFCARAVMKSNEGNIAYAFKDLETAARIGKHMGQDPVVITFLVEIACDSLTRNTGEALLLAHRDDPEVVTAAKRAFEALGPTPDLRRVAGGELVTLRVMMTQFRQGKMPKGTSGNGEERPVGSALPVASPGIQRLMVDAWEAKGIAYWRGSSRCLNDHAGDPLAQYRSLKTYVSNMASRSTEPGNEMISIMVPVFDKAALKVLYAEARRRMQGTLIALVAARQKDSRKCWPASLDTLPRSDTSLYNDPYTGKPLRYQPTPDGSGFTLYSVGDDFTDNNGQSEGLGAEPGSDIVIRFPRN